MTPTQIALFILGSIASLGIIAGGIGYLINTFRKGSKIERSDILSSAEQLAKFWQEQAQGYKTMMEEKDAKYTEKINTLTREVGELKGQLNAETNQKKEYLAILQNRDPETKKFYEYVMKAIENQETVNSEMIRVLKEIHTMTTEERNREMHVEGTIIKTAS